MSQGLYSLKARGDVRIRLNDSPKRIDPQRGNVQIVRGLVFTSLVLVGCAHQSPVETAKADPVHLFERSYLLGARSRVAVGDAIVKVKDYYVERTEYLAVRPTHAITIARDSSPTMRFAANRSYPILARFEVDGVSHFVVPDPLSRGVAAIVRPDGVILQRAAGVVGNAVSGLAWFDSTVSPSDARMPQEVEDRVLRAKGYVNYELIYNGASGGHLHMTYREFTPENIARTAYFQRMDYDANAEIVSFRKLKIRVHAATNENIDFTVVEEG